MSKKSRVCRTTVDLSTRFTVILIPRSMLESPDKNDDGILEDYIEGESGFDTMSKATRCAKRIQEQFDLCGIEHLCAVVMDRFENEPDQDTLK